jgi:predicted CopG family antitoxin
MSIKPEVQAIIDQLDDQASWDDFIRELIRRKKLTLGMREDELAQENLSDSDVNAIISRIYSSQSLPDDMRNTNRYKPGNATTLGMVSGVLAIVFAFVFPPIAWLGAAVAVLAGGFGLSRKEEKAWIPILLAMVSLLPYLLVFSS